MTDLDKQIDEILKLPHIQEFYDYCKEEDIPEEIMYKIAGWLGSEVYFVPANASVVISKYIASQKAELLDRVLVEVIGEDEADIEDYDHISGATIIWSKDECNKLRATQRTQLNKLKEEQS